MHGNGGGGGTRRVRGRPAAGDVAGPRPGAIRGRRRVFRESQRPSRQRFAPRCSPGVCSTSNGRSASSPESSPVGSRTASSRPALRGGSGARSSWRRTPFSPMRSAPTSWATQNDSAGKQVTSSTSSSTASPHRIHQPRRGENGSPVKWCWPESLIDETVPGARGFVHCRMRLHDRAAHRPRDRDAHRRRFLCGRPAGFRRGGDCSRPRPVRLRRQCAPGPAKGGRIHEQRRRGQRDLLQQSGRRIGHRVVVRSGHTLEPAPRYRAHARHARQLRAAWRASGSCSRSTAQS